MTKNRCSSQNPVRSIGHHLQCDLRVGHDGPHKSTRREDGFTAAVTWAADPPEKELDVLRRIAVAAEVYLEHSELRQAMHWAQKLDLNNTLATWRNMKETEKRST